MLPHKSEIPTPNTRYSELIINEYSDDEKNVDDPQDMLLKEHQELRIKTNSVLSFIATQHIRSERRLTQSEKKQAQLEKDIKKLQQSKEALTFKMNDGQDIQSLPDFVYPQAARRKNRFLSGIGVFLNFVWPLSFWGLFTHDLAYFYNYPNERYGNSLGKLLLGISPNEKAYTSHLGLEILPFEFWPGFLCIGMATVIAGAIVQLQDRNLAEITTVAELKELLTFEKGYIIDIGYALFNTKMGRYFEIINFLCSEHEFKPFAPSNEITDSRRASIPLEKRLAIIDILISFAKDHRFFARFLALQSLGLFVKNFKKTVVGLMTTAELDYRRNYQDEFSSPQLRRFLSRNDSNGLKPEELNTLFLSARGDIEQTAAYSQLSRYPFNKPLVDTYINALKTLRDAEGLFQYPAWDINEHQSSCANLFYIPKILTRRAQFQLIFLFLYGLWKWGDYLYRKIECESNSGFFKYWDIVASDVCTSCDWGLLPQAITMQGCLNSLFEQKNSAKELLTQLKKLKPSKEVSYLDLSSVDWTSFTFDAWDELLSELETVIMAPLQHVKFSRESVQVNEPLKPYVERFILFLQKVRPDILDVTNQNLGPDNIVLLMQGIPNGTLSKIYLAGNNGGNECAKAVAEQINLNRLLLKIIGLENNNIDNFGLKMICASLQSDHSTVVDLNLAYNAFDSREGLLILGKSFTAKNSLKRLDISGLKMVAHAEKTLSQFAQAIEQSSTLTNLIMNDCDLDDSDGEGLQPLIRKLKHFSVANNLFTEEGITLVLSTPNAQLINFDVSGNDIEEMSKVASKLPDTLLFFAMRDNPLSSSNFNNTISALAATHIEGIDASGIAISEEEATYFSQVFSTRKTPLKQIIFNRCDLTTDAAAAILKIPDAEEISFIDNDISTGIGESLRHALTTNKKLISINLKKNHISSNETKIAALGLADSSLQRLILDGNPIGDAGKVAILAQTIQATPHIEKLGATDDDISRDERRAQYESPKKSALQFFSALNTGEQEETLRAASRTGKNTGITMFFQNTKIAPHQFVPDRFATREISTRALRSNTTNNAESLPPSSLNWGMLAIGSCATVGLIVILYLLFRAFNRSQNSEAAATEIKENNSRTLVQA